MGQENYQSICITSRLGVLVLRYGGSSSSNISSSSSGRTHSSNISSSSCNSNSSSKSNGSRKVIVMVVAVVVVLVVVEVCNSHHWFRWLINGVHLVITKGNKLGIYSTPNYSSLLRKRIMQQFHM